LGDSFTCKNKGLLGAKKELTKKYIYLAPVFFLILQLHDEEAK
jgi:hypothetical protein